MQSYQSDVGLAPRSLHVIIVGAGLSGLVAAIGLRKSGHNVKVLEQTAGLREVGAGIQLPANSSRILDELGLLERVKTYAIQPADLIIRSYRGEELYRQNLNPTIQQKFRYPHLLVHRADLRRILYDEARSQGASIKMGACVRSIKFEMSEVELVTGEQYKADLIIGADGEHSVCRKSLLGDSGSGSPHSSGDTVFRLAIPASKITPHPSIAALVSPPCVHAWYGPGSHAVCYQLQKDDLFNIVLTFPEPEHAAVIGPQPADLANIRNLSKNWDPSFQQLLGLAESALKWSLLQTDDLDNWMHPSGHLVLIGDSAHATLPYLAQGAALALESAHILSTLLQHISDLSQLPRLLKSYVNVRIPRAPRTTQRSKDMHDMCQLVDGAAQRERDRMFREEKPGDRVPNPWADPGFQEWMWAFDARKVAETVWGNIEKIFTKTINRRLRILRCAYELSENRAGHADS